MADIRSLENFATHPPSLQQMESLRARLAMARDDMNYDLNELQDELETLYDLVNERYWDLKSMAAYRATFPRKEADDATTVPPPATDPLHY